MKPTNQEIVMMAGAILGQPEGTADNRHPLWLDAVAQAERAYAALAALRSMPAEPVAWGMCKNGLILDCITPAEHERYEGEYTVPLFGAAQTALVPAEPDWKHPKIQGLISADARNRICIDLVWRILQDPRQEFTASDMDYWDTLHDEVQKTALAATPHLSDAWQPIETAPKDGSVFVVARFVECESPEPDFDYELGHYKPLVFDRYEEAGDNLFRKVPEQVYDWHGFNNFGRMTHWMPLPPPVERAVLGRGGEKL